MPRVIGKIERPLLARFSWRATPAAPPDLNALDTLSAGPGRRSACGRPPRIFAMLRLELQAAAAPPQASGVSRR